MSPTNYVLYPRAEYTHGSIQDQHLFRFYVSGFQYHSNLEEALRDWEQRGRVWCTSVYYTITHPGTSTSAGFRRLDHNTCVTGNIIFQKWRIDAAWPPPATVIFKKDRAVVQVCTLQELLPTR